jgi:hypothetical protein
MAKKPNRAWGSQEATYSRKPLAPQARGTKEKEVLLEVGAGRSWTTVGSSCQKRSSEGDAASTSRKGDKSSPPSPTWFTPEPSVACCWAQTEAIHTDPEKEPAGPVRLRTMEMHSRAEREAVRSPVFRGLCATSPFSAKPGKKWEEGTGQHPGTRMAWEVNLWSRQSHTLGGQCSQTPMFPQNYSSLHNFLCPPCPSNDGGLLLFLELLA